LRIVMNDDNLGNLHSSTVSSCLLLYSSVTHTPFDTASPSVSESAHCRRAATSCCVSRRARYLLQGTRWHQERGGQIHSAGRRTGLARLGRRLSCCSRPHSSTLGARAAPDIRQSGYPSVSHPAAQFFFAHSIRPHPRRTQLPCNIRPSSTPLPSFIRPPSPPPPPAASLQSFSHPAAQFFFVNWIRPLPRQAQLPCNIRPRSTPLPSVIRPPSPPPPPAASLQSRYRSKRGR
jgi:hypothetical protein